MSEENERSLNRSRVPLTTLSRIFEESIHAFLWDNRKRQLESKTSRLNVETATLPKSLPILPYKIIIHIDSKQQILSEGINIIQITVNCNKLVEVNELIKDGGLPSLSHFIVEMQETEKENMLVVQQFTGSSSLGKRLGLRLMMDQSTGSIHIAEESETSFACENGLNQSSTSILFQIKVSATSIVEDVKTTFDLLHATKLLNPDVQLSLSSSIGGILQMNLYDLDFVQFHQFKFKVHSGSDIHSRNNTWSCSGQACHIECGDMIQTTLFGKLDKIFITCISCFTPLQGDAVNGKCGNTVDNKNALGFVSFRIYGPNGMPILMKDSPNLLPFHPSTFTSWSDFGIQLKMTYKYSGFDLRCSAKIAKQEWLPNWIASCDKFSLLLAYVLTPTQEGMSRTLSSVRSELELSRDCKQQLLKDHTPVAFHEATYSSLLKLIGSTACSTLSLKQVDSRAKETFQPEVYSTMIPDIANSLTDMFIRSTNTEFRLNVSHLAPTENRATMSKHVEKCLWNLLGCHESNADEDTDAKPPLGNQKDEKEICVDDWSDSQFESQERHFEDRRNDFQFGMLGLPNENEQKGNQYSRHYLQNDFQQNDSHSSAQNLINHVGGQFCQLSEQNEQQPHVEDPKDDSELDVLSLQSDVQSEDERLPIDSPFSPDSLCVSSPCYEDTELCDDPLIELSVVESNSHVHMRNSSPAETDAGLELEPFVLPHETADAGKALLSLFDNSLTQHTLQNDHKETTLRQTNVADQSIIEISDSEDDSPVTKAKNVPLEPHVSIIKTCKLDQPAHFMSDRDQCTEPLQSEQEKNSDEHCETPKSLSLVSVVCTDFEKRPCFPRKRSSEYIDDITDVMRSCSVEESTSSEICIDAKRFKPRGEKESPDLVNCDVLDELQFSQDSLNFSEDGEEDVLKHWQRLSPLSGQLELNAAEHRSKTSQLDDSEDWLNEEEFSKWQANMT